MIPAPAVSGASSAVQVLLVQSAPTISSARQIAGASNKMDASSARAWCNKMLVRLETRGLVDNAASNAVQVLPGQNVHPISFAQQIAGVSSKTVALSEPAQLYKTRDLPEMRGPVVSAASSVVPVHRDQNVIWISSALQIVVVSRAGAVSPAHVEYALAQANGALGRQAEHHKIATKFVVDAITL